MHGFDKQMNQSFNLEQLEPPARAGSDLHNDNRSCHTMADRGSIAATLESAIAACTEGRLKIVNDAALGRCLAAAKPIVIGESFTDETLYLGSSQGRNLIRVCGSAAPLDIKNARNLADLDLAAVVAEEASTRDASRNASLAAALSLESPGIGTEAAQRVHQLLPQASRVPWEILSERWRAFPLNWRRVTGFIGGSIAAATATGGGQRAVFTLHAEVFSGLFLLNSIIEHSCRPNLGTYWDRGALHFVALQDIPAGAHVSMSYLDLFDLSLSCQDRRKILKETWHFDCCCSLCVDSPSQVRVSDERHAIQVPTESSSWNHWRVELDVLATNDIADVEKQLQRCRTALNNAVNIAESCLQSRMEQGILQLLLFKAIFGDKNDAQDVAQVCSELLGDDSEVTTFLRALTSHPHDALEIVLRKCEEVAIAAGFGASEIATQRRSLATLLGTGRTFGQLCHDGLMATTGRMVLCKELYIPELPVRPVCSGVVERSPLQEKVPQSSGGYEARPRVSRFKQQRNLQQMD